MSGLISVGDGGWSPGGATLDMGRRLKKLTKKTYKKLLVSRRTIKLETISQVVAGKQASFL